MQAVIARLRSIRLPSSAGSMLSVFSPLALVSKYVFMVMVLVQVTVVVAWWSMGLTALIPRPMAIIHAFANLWMHEGFSRDLGTSFILNLEALAIATAISLGLSYLTVMPFFQSIAGFVSKLRFLGLVGLTFLFTLASGSGHELKLWLLVFGMTVFFVTFMAAEVAAIPKDQFDYARTLRMGKWRVVWEVVILGKLDIAFEGMRQNAAMGWMMLTMVEGISRSEGGVGAMLLTQNRQFDLSAVFAIQISLLVLGLCIDYGIGLLKRFTCPYAFKNLERR